MAVFLVWGTEIDHGTETEGRQHGCGRVLVRGMVSVPHGRVVSLVTVNEFDVSRPPSRVHHADRGRLRRSLAMTMPQLVSNREMQAEDDAASERAGT